jgi:hypothetical protein
MSWLKNAMKTMAILGTVSAVSVWAQPTPAPTTGDAPCTEEANVNPTDTVNSGGGVDADGYFPMFDGTFKGWFQSCKTGHSEGSNVGAIFRIGQADGKPAIYSTQRGSTTGGLLMTNKKFTNYEFVFQTWPDYGNDGGFFNRTPINGRCFQTVLDYIQGASVGGTWGEGGFTGRDFRPFSYNGNEQTLTIPGNGNGEMSNWTTITQKLKASGSEPNLPCPNTGCTQAEWRTLWDMDGWNDFKVQFYGGSATGTGNIHMKTWFKKPTATVWVPVIQDTTLAQVVPAGYVGLQVHGGGRFGGAKGTWYRNIRWRPLDDKGVPIPQKPKDGTSLRKDPSLIESRLTATASMITGSMNMDYTMSVLDLKGRTLESFSGKSGAVNHAFKTNVYGPLTLRISTEHGVKTSHVTRVAD